MLTWKQHRTLQMLRDSVMTPDRFNHNGLAYDTVIPGPMIGTILEILEDYDKRIQAAKEAP